MSDTMNYEDTLEHYGVKGMKWGVRRSDAELSKGKMGKKSDEKPARKSGDAKKAASSKGKASTKGVDSLTNKELKDLNERLNLEANYKRMNPAQQSMASKGASIARGMALDMTLNAVKQVGTQLLVKEMKKHVGLK